jgi:fucose permease
MTAASHDDYPRTKIFVLSSLALFTAGLSFALRAAIISAIESDVIAQIDPEHSGELAGGLLGTAFLGFGLTLFFGSVFLQRIGMGREILLCAICFGAGTLLSVSADTIASGPEVYDVLRAGFLLSGLGWGFMEASVNPLTAALYPDDKTNRLNIVHAWWPAGVIVGGLIGVSADTLGLDWRGQFAFVVLPALGCIGLCLGTRFPSTERASMGVSMSEMFAEIRKQPMFLVWWLCMLLTAAAELAPGQWIDFTLSRSVGMRGIWLVIYVNGMMFALRHFAGPIAHRVSTVVMLWASAVLATLGLILLPLANSPATGLAVATVWGLGVCFLWPTMLANVSERFARGGELFIGLMGVAGALSIHYVLPAMGAIFDRERLARAGGEAAFAALSEQAAAPILREATRSSFHHLAAWVALLIVVFGAIALFERRTRSARAQESR